MYYEKSCGAVVYRRQSGKIEYLLILNKKPGTAGHWGFPKGHVETGETEEETARREILEETGLPVRFIPGFRTVSHYSPRPGAEKDAIYFLAELVMGEIKLQESEVAAYKWCTPETAMDLLTHDAAVLDEAIRFLNEREIT